MHTFSENKLFINNLFCCLFSLSFIFALIFIISFLLLTLDFVFLFLVPLSVRLHPLFEVFLIFFEIDLYCYKFPSYAAFAASQNLGMLYFHFHLSLCIFSFLPLLLPWPHSYSVAFALFYQLEPHKMLNRNGERHPCF